MAADCAPPAEAESHTRFRCSCTYAAIPNQITSAKITTSAGETCDWIPRCSCIWTMWFEVL